MTNSIAADSNPAGNSDVVNGCCGLPVTYSDIETPGTGITLDGTDISADPLLGPLADNGGTTQGAPGNLLPTRTMLPAPGSPVIDKGNSADPLIPATDQRGAARIQGTAVDMGSVETAPVVVLQPGTLSFSSPIYTVTENGTVATITVTRTGGADGAVSVTYTTSNGTATAGADYTPATGTLSWADADATSKTFTIPIIDDNIVEGDETVNLALSNPTGGATIGTGAAVLTITDVEPGTIVVSGGPAVTVNESAGTVTITLNRTNGSSGSVTVDFSTTPGTAQAGADFTAVSGSVTWTDGDTAPKTITIPITVDSVAEPPETFTLNLSSTTPGAIVSNPVVTITIIDAADVPTLAFWMKLMLALTCAGVGVIMLKNGRLLVVVLAAGVALAAAPPAHTQTGPDADSLRDGRPAPAESAARLSK
jgi:hypothetical protein